jgi:hypothetical protein
MKIVSTTLLSCLLAARFASAALITFDDLPAPSVSGTALTSPYHGLTWWNFFYADAFNNDLGMLVPGSPGSGYHNGVVSSPNVGAMANASLGEFSLITGPAFDFKSAWLTAAYQTGLNIRLRGYSGGTNGTLLYETNVIVDTSGPTLFDFNFNAIDALRFDVSGGVPGPYGDHGLFFVIEDITITPVPDTDGDGILDNVDQCVSSDLRPKVDVNGNETGNTSIGNSVNAQGCSLQDLVNACAAGAANHGQYVSCITDLANQLLAAGTISKAQRQEMITGAAKSKIGK